MSSGTVSSIWRIELSDVPIVSFPALSLATAVNWAFAPSSYPSIAMKSDLGTLNSICPILNTPVILISSPRLIYEESSKRTWGWNIPPINVSSSAGTGTFNVTESFVEFQYPKTIFPPETNTVSNSKSAGGVISNKTDDSSVVASTVSPTFPTKSENPILNGI